MHSRRLLLPLLLWVSLPALADGGPEQAAVAIPQASASRQIGQQLQQHGAKVQQLQRQVSAQEEASQQAAQRLQLQDRRIAELTAQLQALERTRQAGSGTQ